MIQVAKRTLRALGLDTRALYYRIQLASLEAAIREQNLSELRHRLRQAVPDVSDQYTAPLDAGDLNRFWEAKMRSLHAFQVDCVIWAIQRLGRDGLTVIDVGDSAGNHAAYLRKLVPGNQIQRFISVNIDPVAVEKIRAKGGEAILCRAEDLAAHAIRPDLFVTFEMLEHLRDPLGFLHSLAKACPAPLVASVPYRRVSRFGGDRIRLALTGRHDPLSPESVHLFELCPDDWTVLLGMAGFRVREQRIYRQYPLNHPLHLTRGLWRRTDFEGFVVFYAEPDTRVADLYSGW